MPNLTTIGRSSGSTEEAPLLGCPANAEVCAKMRGKRSAVPSLVRACWWLSCTGQMREPVAALRLQEADELRATVDGMDKYETMDLELRNSPLAQACCCDA
jgi:hypothetical protein